MWSVHPYSPASMPDIFESCYTDRLGLMEAGRIFSCLGTWVETQNPERGWERLARARLSAEQRADTAGLSSVLGSIAEVRPPRGSWRVEALLSLSGNTHQAAWGLSLYRQGGNESANVDIYINIRSPHMFLKEGFC